LAAHAEIVELTVIELPQVATFGPQAKQESGAEALA